jgi:hypothetical protein
MSSSAMFMARRFWAIHGRLIDSRRRQWMGLRPTHLGYAYQDLLTALRLVDLMLGRATTVIVDTKAFKGDLFDDVTSEWGFGDRQRLQIKHTANERQLTSDSFMGDRRGLQLDEIVTSIDKDLRDHPGTSYRIVLRDTEPQEPDLTAVLMRVAPSTDPGPVLHGLTSTRMRFDPEALLAADPWRSTLVSIDADVLRRVCDVLVVDVGLPAFSLDIRNPGPAEQALLRRVADELGAGRPPNRHRTPEDVAHSLLQAAQAARSTNGTVTARDLVPRLDLAVDFGAVHEGHPIDRSVEITRPTVLNRVATTVRESVVSGATVVLSGGPGAGKTWLCEQLAEGLDGDWIVARHHCWLGAADAQRDRRVLMEVVVGSLLQQLETAAPEAVAGLRPRFAATAENLQAAVAEVRRARPEQPVVLVVDGLDHVTRVLGRTAGAAFARPDDPARLLVEELAGLQLPGGAVLLLASQPGDHLAPLGEASAAETVPPLSHPEVRDLAERLGVHAAFLGTGDRGEAERADAAVELIYERSRGNALYATYLCRQAVGPAPVLDGGAPREAPAADALDRLRDVPASAQDLDAYYSYLLVGLTGEQRFAVGLLAVCDFAVSAHELREIFPDTAPMLPAALSTVAPIVTQQPGIGGLKIHHESFGRFVRREMGDDGWLTTVRAAAATWLSGRGFFTDARAFRHLPELLVELDSDDELAALIGPDFLSRAIAGLQPPAAITHVLNLAARRGAARRDWLTLVRCVELRRAADTYGEEGIPGTLVDYADVLVALLGAEAVAASLVYDGIPTVAARWGLQLCAAVDRAGAAAPWETYLTAWEEGRERDNVHYGRESDQELLLAVQRGYLRLPKRRRERSHGSVDGDTEGTSAARLADHLAQDGLPPVARLLTVLIDGLGAAPLLDAARLVADPPRQAEILLHLADVSAAGHPDLPSPLDLALEAWESSPGADPLRALRHGVPVSQLAGTVLGADIDATLHTATQEVLRESNVDRPDVVRRWLTLLAVAHKIDPHAGTRLLPQLEEVGFYRGWLRFAVATVGLRRDVDAGAVTPNAASTAVRVALEHLAQTAQHFTGRPRAVDLWSIHSLVHEVLEEAIGFLAESDLEPALAALTTISDGTTASLMGMAGSGPLTTTALLAMLSRTVDRTGAEVVHRLMDQLRHKRESGGTHYSESAAFELEMARISLTAGDAAEARRCWERAARYMASYGSHKDVTLLELLDPLPNLAAADPTQARTRLAQVHPLTYLVTQHTDGRETAAMPGDWWRHLADLDPRAAGVLAAQLLLTQPGLEDLRADAAHRRLLRSQAAEADPVVLAALRVAAGAGGRDLDGDIALLDRLAVLPADDPARATGVLPILANAITATYDDQPLMHTSNGEGPEPTAALREAAHRLGGDGGPPRQRKPKPQPEQSRRWFGGPRQLTVSHVLHAGQRPELPCGAAGAVAAVRDHLGNRYDDDPAAPRWTPDALVNAVGWRLMQMTADDGTDAAIRLLHRIAEELRGLSDGGILADIAAGLHLRRAEDPERMDRLTSTAYTLAFTKIRGGGGWRTFAGRDRLDLWVRATAVDTATAVATLADQVVAAMNGRPYGTYGITQALVAAFAAQPPDPARPVPIDALACWDAAFTVIAYRLPGTVHLGSEGYEPTTGPVVQDGINIGLGGLALATLAMPERADRRRALVAATVLLAARPTVAQAAASRLLATDLGAGPLTWLLTVLRDGVRSDELADDLADQLADLAQSDLLSVRVLAADILSNAGRQAPAPPATAAHPAVTRALADARDEGT